MNDSDLIEDRFSIVLIDLDRGNLLEHLFQLSHDFCVADLLFKRELGGDLGERLCMLGLDVVELSAKEVAKAALLRRNVKVLSTPVTFAFSVAEAHRWTLLTKDLALRRLAEQHGVKMHGLLWIIDEFKRECVVEANLLHRALTEIHPHPRYRLPSLDVERTLARLIG